MGKVCAVKSCPSGRKLKTRKHNLPQSSVSYFRPTTPARLQKWSKSLGFELKDYDSICHLHFKEEHIKMYEKLKIHGELQIFPMLKKNLKDEALPTVEHQFVPTHDPQAIHEIKKSNIDHKRLHKDDQHLKIHKKHNKQQKLNGDQYTSNNLSSDNEEIEDDLKDPLSFEQEDKSTQTTEIVNSIKDILKCPMLPQCWLYIEKPNGLEFIRMDGILKQMRNHLRLNMDLTITVICPNKEELPLEVKINSFKSLYEFLRTVERWPLCVGTQFERSEYSKYCRGVIIGDDAYKRHQSNPRCKPCRTLRSRLQSRKGTAVIVEKPTVEKPHPSNIEKTKQNKRLKRMNEQMLATLSLCSKVGRLMSNKSPEDTQVTL